MHTKYRCNSLAMKEQANLSISCFDPLKSWWYIDNNMWLCYISLGYVKVLGEVG